MRVLVVSQYFWPENFRINDLVAEFGKRGHAVSVLTGKPNYPNGKIFPEYRADPKRFANFDGVPVYRVPMMSRGHGSLRLALNYATFALSACLFGPLLLRRQSFDVIFVFEPSPVTVGLPAVLLRRLKRTPIAFWVLDQWPETLLAVGTVRSDIVLTSVGRLVSFIYRRCDLLLAQSRSFIPQIRRYAGNGPRVEYFPSWSEPVPNLKFISAAPELPPRPASFTVMFTGNIGDSQDFPTILDAADLLKHRADIRWVVVGDGRRAQWVRDEVQRRGLAERVTLLGRFPLVRMPSFYKCADALLVSLRAEPVFAMTIPGKIQSYLAAGRPLLAMLDGEGAEIVNRAKAGLVCRAGDSRGLAKIVSQLVGMPENERAALAENARNLSRTEFDRGTLISRLELLLDTLRL